MKKSFCFMKGLSLFLAVSMLSFTACKKRLTDKTNYYSAGVKKEFTIALDSIGLVKRVATNLDTFKNRLAQQNYQVKRSVTDDIFILVPTIQNKKKVFTQKQLILIIKGLIQANKDIIETGGVVAYRDSSKTPYLVNDEIIVQFKPTVTQGQKDSYFNQYKLTVVQQSGFRPQQYLVIPTNNDFTDIFKTIRDITDTNLVEFVAPNFIVPIFPLADLSDEPLIDLQWHIANSGASGGTDDADSDGDLAWEFTKGNRDVTIAVLDNGFEVEHPALNRNWAENVAERGGIAGVDDNPHPPGRPNEVDDFIGWDFHACDGMNTPGCGKSNLDPLEHGTSVAGIISANLVNGNGASGICPDCTVIPIEIGTGAYAIGRAFDYARARGAKIISCSFLYDAGLEAIDQAIKDAYAANIILFIAANNSRVNRCTASGGYAADLASLDVVVGISRASNLDKFDNSGFGNCIDLLGPSYWEGETGTLGIVTTDLTDGSGWGNACADAVPINSPGYTSCFLGTSAATPLVAGIAGLILSVHPHLRVQQIQYLLQDCADKIENSEGKYSSANGYSSPASGIATHGFGRVNAYEAVKIASPDLAAGGRNGVDVFLRDNALDWGNTEKPTNYLFEPIRGWIDHWRSEDIKIDAPPFGPVPANNSGFEAMSDERPAGNANNKVYVRVRNRGFNAAEIVNVKLYWVYGGMALPALWTGFPQDATADPVWHFLGTKQIKALQNSGSSSARINTMMDDGSQIVVFDFAAPDPASNPVNHYCLLAMLDSPEDLLPVSELSAITNLDMVTPYYNNITHRNYSIDKPEGAGIQFLYINNPYKRAVESRISIFNPKKIRIKLSEIYPDSFFTLKPLEKRLMKIDIDPSEIKEPTEITLRQEIWVDKKKKGTGGFTFRYMNKKPK